MLCVCDCCLDLGRLSVTDASSHAVDALQSVMIGKGALFQWLLKYPVSAPQDCLVIDAVCKAQSRTKGFCIGVLKSRFSVAARAAPIIGIGARNASRTGVRKGGIHLGKAILRFPGG